jgi:hypothetical protein
MKHPKKLQSLFRIALLIFSAMPQKPVSAQTPGVVLNGNNVLNATELSAGAVKPNNLDAIRLVDGVTFTTEQAAVTSCPAAPIQCNVLIPPNYAGADVAVCPDVNVTLWDLRSQTYLTNPIHYALNLWDGCPNSKWVNLNSGGLARAKTYIGYTVTSTASPGDTAMTIAFTPLAAQWPFTGGLDLTNEGFAVVVPINTGTDTITNATTNQQKTINGSEMFIFPAGTGLLLNDVRASTQSIASGQGSGQVNRGVAYDAVAMNLPSAFHVAYTVGLRGEDALQGSQTMQLSGNVSVTNGSTAIHWASGDKLAPNVMPGLPIIIGGVTYIISSCLTGSGLGGTQCTLGTNYTGRTSSSVHYTFAGQGYSAYNSGNQRYDATGTGYSDPLGGGGILFDAPSGGSATQQKIWFRDPSATHYADGTLVRMGYYMGECSDSSPGMVWTNSAGTKEACINAAGTIFGGVITAAAQVNLGSRTVSSLPSAAANPGAVLYVTDSTAITTEGQACAGSSTFKALAFSNGVTWKCF